MHQQPNDRSCANEAIGGDHHGPVQVYMASVTDASSADGSSASWFKIFADTWAKNAAGTDGDGDYWGTKDLNACCGRMSVQIPADLAPGDYLLRAEALALHSAASAGQGQFYMTCYQFTVTGSGSAKPAGVNLPGAYAVSDPGILVNIHMPMTTYIAPGPTGASEPELCPPSLTMLSWLTDLYRGSILGWIDKERRRSMRGL